MNLPTLDTLTRRLDRLERERWWWRIGGSALLAMLLLVGASPQSQVADKLVAREFILVDEASNPRGRLGITFGHPELAFDDDPRALTSSTTPSYIEPRMALTEDALAFTGKNRKLRMKLWVARSIDDLPALVLHDEQGRTRIDLSVFQGGPSLIVQDGDRRARVVLGYIGPEHIARGVVQQRPPSSLVLFDKDGKVIWKAP